MVLAVSQSSQARLTACRENFLFQELFAKSTVQFFSFKVALYWEGTTWVKGVFFWGVVFVFLKPSQSSEQLNRLNFHRDCVPSPPHLKGLEKPVSL